MQKNLWLKSKEALVSVLPITIIVLLLHFTITPMSTDILILFLVGAFLLIIGMGLFTLGADVSMMTIGQKLGSHLTKTRNLPFIIAITFTIGVIITIAEPDLKVLAKQTPAVPDQTLIIAVAIGVGIFLVCSFLRILLQIKLSYLLIALYTIVFLIAAFTKESFLSIAFDSGGVTTGPITVPFIMALGLGLASVRGDQTTEEDSFGLVSLCSIGPILTVLLLGIFYNPQGGSYTPISIPSYTNFSAILQSFFTEFPSYFREVAIAVFPIILFFLIFQFVALRLDKKSLVQILSGILYTYIGLVLFLTGVNVGFMPAGHYIGSAIVTNVSPWLLIPLGMIIGYFIVAAEPAVHVFKQQVEDLTEGAISGRSMGLSLSIGVAFSLGLSMLRVITGISIWYLIIPGYLFALTMTFFVPPLFTAIAFDSGGVASGPMTATFLLPFAMGACDACNGNILTDAFGIVAMVAMTPLITIQALGLYYTLKRKKTKNSLELSMLDDTIIEYDIENLYLASNTIEEEISHEA